MSKRRYFLLDEDVPLSLRAVLGRKSIVESIEEMGRKGIPDEEVLLIADDRTAIIITNDAGLAKRYRGLPDRRTHGECHYGLLLITAPNAEAQRRLLARYAKAIVWNEVAEQDMYIHIDAKGTMTAKSLCQHTDYKRHTIHRGRVRKA